MPSSADRSPRSFDVDAFEVPDRKLLTAMRTDWPRFAERLHALAAAARCS
jgi:hypothetical protein